MYYILCIDCGDLIEIPADAVGFEQTDPCNVVECDSCGVSFDYVDEQVQLL